ncbi:MAG: hypothetical protein F6J97_05375 [Leptolyngbya sp. SIO4C1]|nr:hypothetical protein [Leptolyngbya sp. SIO4C1]
MVVGIDQYHFLQPLMYAQNDAAELHQFLIGAGFSPEQCVLLSDLPSPSEAALYPDQQTIIKQLQALCQDPAADGSLLWLFFSGYGVQVDGRDYLMPIDGDPAQVAKTAIPISEIINALKQTAAQNLVLVLDINRSQAALPEHRIGSDAIAQAKAAEIPLLLSCEPEQFSHETLAVRHGLFTAALLEGLRYQGCTTLGHLADYLSTRVPELCDHHWRPIQNPVAVLSDAQKFALVVPQSAAAVLPKFEQPEAGLDQSEPVFEEMPRPSQPVLNPEAGTAVSHEAVPELIAGPEDITLELREDEENLSDITTTVDLPETAEPSHRKSGALLAWGLLGLLLLIGGVLLRNQTALRESFETATLPDWLAWLIPSRDQVAEPQPGAADPEAATIPALSPTPSETVDPTPDAAEAATETSEPADAASEPANEPANEPASEPASATPTEEATSQPAEPETADPETASSAAPPASAQADSAADSAASAASAALLSEARQLIQPSQAHQFAEAIVQARQIQPGEAYYDEAQADIDRWSQVILDLAEGRAASGNLDGAIAAAQLVPSDRESLSRQAQQRIAFWQQRQRSREIIQAAQRIPRMGQASSYQRGIIQLQTVPRSQPEYQTAQQLIDDWSQKMLSIARARAAQGRNQDAIQAAILIPRGTAAYDQAQTDIARWRGE